MLIILPCPLSVETYIERFPDIQPLPDRCPACQRQDSLRRHGVRYRSPPHGAGQSLRVPVRRLRCPACRRIFSLLPSFLLPLRHYPASVIERVLGWRYEAGRSLREIADAFVDGLPTRSTMPAWLRAFSRQATTLVPVAVAFLALEAPP